LLFYNSETVKSEDKQKLRVLEMSTLKKICGISKRDRRRNMDIIKELEVIEKTYCGNLVRQSTRLIAVRKKYMLSVMDCVVDAQ